MKLSLVYTSLALMLLGCADGTFLPLEEEEFVDDHTDNNLDLPESGDHYGSSHGNMCNLYNTMVITNEVNGVEIVVEVPVLCDPSPMINTGDPPPDRINPGDDVEQYENPDDTYNLVVPSYQDSSNLI